MGLDVKVGDKVIRYLSSERIAQPLIVTDIEGEIITCSLWTFDKHTGAEIDDYLTWGPPPLMTGSVIEEATEDELRRVSAGQKT